MPLTWDLTEVKQYKRLYRKANDEGYKQLKEVPHTLILLTMIVGINHITEQNYKKFYNRVHLIEHLRGAFMYKRVNGKPKQRPMQLADVERMIGLKTNASSLSRTKFLQQQTDKDDL
jgi:hypothetical protein